MYYNATTIIIPGDPIAKQRHAGHGRRAWTPRATKVYEQKVAWCARAAGIREPLEGPVGMEITFYLRRPKRLCRKKDPDEALVAPVRPDLSNLAKAVEDALNGIAYHDDGQIVSLKLLKYYCEKGGQPGTVVTIWRMVAEKCADK